MAEYTNEIEIARPVAEVRAAFDDPSLAPRWVTGLQKAEPIDGEIGRAGSHVRYHFAEEGMEFTLERKLHRADDDRRELSFESPVFSTEVEERFEEVDGGGTRVVVRNVVTSSGPPIGDEMVEGMRQRQAGDFERLKEILEAR